MLVLATGGLYSYAYAQHVDKKEPHQFSPNEQIQIDVLYEDDLSRIYTIDDDGMILMPLIGKVHIAGKTASEIEQLLTLSLQDGYILNPEISVTGVIAKYVYVMGEVKNPGRYKLDDHNAGILKAVALAGGFTYRANKTQFSIVRKIQDDIHRTDDNPVDVQLQTGDIIIVKERFF